MRTILPMPLPGLTTDGIQPWETEHAGVSRKAAAAGFVLLKNEDRTLPLSRGARIALYGVGAVRTIKGGTGSGDVNERYDISIAQGLENAGFILTSRDWLDAGEQAYTDSRNAWRDEILRKAAEPNVHFFTAYSSTPFRMPSGPEIPSSDPDTDTAVYVLSRIAGEGADRTDSKGDYYLTDEEEKAIHDICAVYSRVILGSTTFYRMSLTRFMITISVARTIVVPMIII